MERLKGILTTISTHRIFVPALIAAMALTIGLLLAFEHTRTVLKVRGPYLAVITAIVIFPIYAFRFFDPHEDSRPISCYFVVVSLYYIFLGSPDFVNFLRHVLFERVPPGAIKQLLFGVVAFAGLAGGLHYALKIWLPAVEGERRFLSISGIKFVVYAILHVIYLNLFVAIAREKFGISSMFS